MNAEALVYRVRGEFHEMPGLRLTFAQACRLWQMDPGTCDAVLAALIQERVLHKTRDGHYIALPSPRRATARVIDRQLAS
jgi:hypothetical protein